MNCHQCQFKEDYEALVDKCLSTMKKAVSIAEDAPERLDHSDRIKRLLKNDIEMIERERR